MRLPLDWRNVRAIGNPTGNVRKTPAPENASHKSNSAAAAMLQQWDFPRIVILRSDRLFRNFL
jgi:hypothetical protein